MLHLELNYRHFHFIDWLLTVTEVLAESHRQDDVEYQEDLGG